MATLNSLQRKRLQAELARVVAARLETEFRIEEHLDNIKKLEENITISTAKETELNQKIKELEE